MRPAGGWDPNPPLQTARLRLEPQRAGHAGAMQAVLADPRVHAFLPSSPPDVEALRERFARLESRRSPDGREGWLNWVVFPRLDGPALGTVQATVRPVAAEADLAYVFAPHAWGQGYGTEAVGALLSFLAGRWGVREAVAQVDTRNHASIRLLTRLGFRQTGFTPHADTFRGEGSDEFTFRLLLAAPRADGQAFR
ncbi:GNAT family N-acetyltransferase [Deinococcus budaensis]|uniref:RimJ/RimL family protein N-acetyltransferase n=1 Tax=Deinococcus budaensis TaxID=1665626 RepID=A0A7W8LNC7_9DEIO|nr:GNAT family N-acetyltransferase [Deinococcus budaensis]MBB5232593.1 RimJ/RimL family protein N-acetyltransferase [Deinococcus budaensis]